MTDCFFMLILFLCVNFDLAEHIQRQGIANVIRNLFNRFGH